MQNTTPLGSLRTAALTTAVFFVSIWTQSALAALIVNPAQTITQEVRVQPIIVSNSDTTNTAGYFGNSTQEADIKAFIDTIWAQAGIDVTWLTPNTWNNTFANIGDPTDPDGAGPLPANNNPRPQGDLSTIRSTGISAGVTNPDPTVINMFFVEIAAGFGPLSNNSVAGLAFVSGNGVSQFVGDNLPGFLGGQEVVASVVAHEIGHNLGLAHIVETENLMQASGASNQGERLNSAQIATALNSSFSVAVVPEPSTYALAVVGVLLLAVFVRRRNRSRAAAS